MPRRLRCDDYSIGWVCALAVELAAAQEMLDETHDTPHYDSHDTNIYTCGRVGEHNVVIASLPEGQMGTDSAAEAAGKLQSTFRNTRFGLMVGIGGGVPSDEADIRLGDVVVSKPQRGHGGVVQYDAGKATPNGIQRTGFLNAPPRVLLTAATNIRATHMRGQSRLPEHIAKLERIPMFRRDRAGPDVLFAADYGHIRGSACMSCDPSKQELREARENGEEVTVHYGTIASGNQVIKDAVVRDRLSQELGTVLCFEMEAAGLMNRFPCLVIRGICDYADAHKNKRWQPYAAATAAGYAKELLLVIPASELSSAQTADDIMSGVADSRLSSIYPAGRDTPDDLPDWLSNFGLRRSRTLNSKRFVGDSSQVQECLQSLAFSEQEQRYHNIRTATDTCHWLLTDPSYLRWTESSRGLFWIKGHPGTGKSVLTKFALIAMREAQPTDVIVSFFIHGQGIEMQRTSLGLFRALLNSVLGKFPKQLTDLTKVFEDRNQRYGDYKEGRWTWTAGELQDTFSRVVTEGSPSQGVTVFLDALDECGKELANDLLAYFNKQAETKTANFRICISSRHYPILGLEHSLSVVAEERNAQDIHTYVRDQLNAIQSDSKREQIQNGILERAKGGFQWALLVTKMMVDGDSGGFRLDKLLAQLSSCPDSLSDLYATLLSGIPRSESAQTRKLFEWILFAERPLSAQELREALVTDSDMVCNTISQLREHDNWSDTLEAFERRVKYLSNGLVEFQTREFWELYDPDDDWNREAHLIHQSVADFLLERLVQRIPTPSPHTGLRLAGVSHFRISRSCMRYMILDELLEAAQMPRASLSSKYPLAPYAARYVFQHIRSAEKEGMDQRDLLLAIHWISCSEASQKLARLWRALDPDSAHAPIGWPFPGATALHILAACGSKSACSAVLETDPNELDRLDPNGNSSLMLAIREGHLDLSLMLLDHHLQQQSLLLEDPHNKTETTEVDEQSIRPAANVNIVNDEDDTALTIALDQMAGEMVLRLIQAGADINIVQHSRLVSLAIRNKDIPLLDLLISRRVSLNGAVYYALDSRLGLDPQDLSKLLLKLIEAGADLIQSQELRDSALLGFSPYDDRHAIIVASRRGMTDLVELMLSSGASITDCNEYGENALLVAVRYSRFRTAQILLNYAPTAVDIADRYGATALSEALDTTPEFVDLLLHAGHFENPEEVLKKSVFQVCRRGLSDMLAILLRQSGIQLDAKDGEDCTPLSVSAGRGNETVVKMLLETSAVDVNSKDSSGETPLFKAAAAGHEGAVGLLLNHNADPAITDKEGLSPLTSAAIEGHFNVVTLLLQKGAQANTPGGTHGNALQAASFRGHKKIVQVLLDNNADVNAKGGKVGTASRGNPLAAAVWQGHREIVELLLDRGAIVDQSIERYGTALGIAAYKGWKDIVEYLLIKGGDLHRRGSYFSNAITAAAYGGSQEIVQLLLDRGADMHSQGKVFANALDAAVGQGNIEISELLLSKGADVNQRGGENGSVIGAAVQGGDYDTVQLLFQKGADLSVVNGTGSTLLHMAVRHHSVELLEFLLQEGLPMDAVDNNRSTPLMIAAINDRYKAAELLLKKGAQQSSDKDGCTPLHAAADWDNTDVAELLLDHGARHTPDKDNWTPLHSASLKGHVKTVELLLRRNADLAATESHGNTPLWVASGRGRVETVRLLLERGAEVNRPDVYGCTALRIASSEGYLKVVEVLLGNKADHTPDNHGWTPLAGAAFNGHLAIVRLLLDRTTPSSVDEEGWTPLMRAASSDHAETVDALLEKGADATKASLTGWTALHAAARNGHLDVVASLLSNGALVTALDEHGWSAVNLAANQGHSRIVKLLLEKGADPSVPNGFGKSALHVAGHSGHAETVELLLQMGAYTAVNGLDPSYGTIAVMCASKGYTDCLRFLADHHNVDLHKRDAQGRTLLQLTAKSGHVDAFQFLAAQNVDVSALDAKGDSLVSFAASGGSAKILDMTLAYEANPAGGFWTPLHWACRAGSPGIIETLVERHWKGGSVFLSEMPGEWTPVAIAVFHGHRHVLEKLTAASQVALGFEARNTYLEGVRHGGALCNGCHHEMYGPRFKCHTCTDFDYCFMCKPFLEHLHKDHEWERRERGTGIWEDGPL